MGIWKPSPGETLLARVPVTFATGAAMRVRGRRWFRDEERNDIQAELSGWPAGPVHGARSTGVGAVWAALRISGLAIGALIVAALPTNTGVRTGWAPRTAANRADELEDFPVLWAAPGAIARTLPWQLDPARSDQRRFRTHLIVTDHRLVVVGLPFNERRCHELPVEDEVLWEVPRSDVQRVERQDFKGGEDFKIVFTDGSWCRLHSLWREFLMRHLADRPNIVPSDSLSPALREAVERFAVGHGPDALPSPGRQERLRLLPHRSSGSRHLRGLLRNSRPGDDRRCRRPGNGDGRLSLGGPVRRRPAAVEEPIPTDAPLSQGIGELAGGGREHRPGVRPRSRPLPDERGSPGDRPPGARH